MNNSHITGTNTVSYPSFSENKNVKYLYFKLQNINFGHNILIIQIAKAQMVVKWHPQVA